MNEWTRNESGEWKINDEASWLIVPGTWKLCPTDNVNSVSRFGVIPDKEAADALDRIDADFEKRAATKIIRVISKSGKETVREMTLEKSGKIWIWTFEASTGKQAIARLKRLHHRVIEISA